MLKLQVVYRTIVGLWVAVVLLAAVLLLPGSGSTWPALIAGILLGLGLVLRQRYINHV